MSDRPYRVVHISPRVQAHGGIETLHEYHRWLALPQVFVAFFDRRPETRADYVNLGFTWRTPLWLMRRRFRRVLALHGGSLVAYHNGWGLPLFHDLDGATRRVVFFHANPAYHEADLPSFAGLVDGAVGVTPALRETWKRTLPELTPDRTTILRAPVEAPSIARPPRMPGEPIILGYAGRIERAQKRLDRLPALIQALRESGCSFRFELLGDGALRAKLERKLEGQVRFHGWRPKEDYWRILSQWDGFVFFSEYEGGAIALFEAMAMGVIPFFPAIGGSWGDIYVPQIELRCYYPPGDMTALGRAINEVFQLPVARLVAMGGRARALIMPHRREEYEAGCLALFRAVMERPRISTVRRRGLRATDLLPLGVVTRLAPSALRLA